MTSATQNPADMRDRISQIGAQHVERAMAKIDDVAEAIDQCKAARHHDQERGERERIRDEERNLKPST